MRGRRIRFWAMVVMISMLFESISPYVYADEVQILEESASESVDSLSESESNTLEDENMLEEQQLEVHEVTDLDGTVSEIQCNDDCLTGNSVSALNISQLTLAVGQKYALKVNGLIDNVVWESSDPKVVKVSKKGVLRAVKKGYANIYAIIDDVRMKCEITVEAPHFEAKKIQVEVDC